MSLKWIPIGWQKKMRILPQYLLTFPMKVLDFPKIRQYTEYDCGVSVLEAVLAYYGKSVRGNRIARFAKTNTRIGTMHKNILLVLKRYHIHTKSKKMSVSSIKHSIKKWHPVLLSLQAWWWEGANYKRNKNWHWVTAIGYTRKKIIFADPYTFERTYLRKKELEKRWHGKEWKKYVSHLWIRVSGKIRFQWEKIIPMR